MYLNLPQSELLWVFIWKQGVNYITILRNFKVFIGILKHFFPLNTFLRVLFNYQEDEPKKKKMNNP